MPLERLLNPGGHPSEEALRKADLTSVELAARDLHPLGRSPIATRFYHVARATR